MRGRGNQQLAHPPISPPNHSLMGTCNCARTFFDLFLAMVPLGYLGTGFGPVLVRGKANYSPLLDECLAICSSWPPASTHHSATQPTLRCSRARQPRNAAPALMVACPDIFISLSRCESVAYRSIEFWENKTGVELELTAAVAPWQPSLRGCSCLSPSLLPVLAPSPSLLSLLTL